jgi:hypothetical protein
MRGHDRRVRRGYRLVLLSAIVVVVGIAAVAFHGTRYDTQAALTRLPTVRERGAPAWSKPCWRHYTPPYHGWYTLACARVEGRVIYRQGRDPDGDGDAHLLVVAGPRMVNLKFRFAGGGAGLPGVGGRVRVVGLLTSGRLHVPEVEVRRIG